MNNLSYIDSSDITKFLKKLPNIIERVDKLTTQAETGIKKVKEWSVYGGIILALGILWYVSKERK